MSHTLTRNYFLLAVKTKTAWWSGSRRFLLAALAALLATAFVEFVEAEPAYARRPIDSRILLIGNSFSRGLKPRLKSLIRSAGGNPLIKSVAKNGATLASHVSSATTLSRISSEPWDYVLLQEQSLGIFNVRYPAARTLDAYIAANGSQSMFFMTWRDRDDALTAYDSLRGVPGGEVGYVPIATELGAPLAPIGWAFRNVVERGLYTGLWAKDAHHAGSAGRYLAACVIYASVFGKSPEGLWAPGSLDPAEASYYQSLAAETVFTEADVWNVTVAPPPLPAVQVAVSGSADDAMESLTNGQVSSAGSLSFGAGKINALRFRNIAVPRGATVIAAQLEVAPGSGRVNPITLLYQAVSADSAPPLNTANWSLSSLSTGSNSLVEAPPAYESGSYNASGDLAPLIQELIDRPGWSPGNAITLLVSDLGSSAARTVKSYDVRPSLAPRLQIEYLP